MNFIKDHTLLTIILVIALVVIIGSFWYKYYINSIQSANYEVVEKNSIYEIRHYEPYLVAQTNIKTADFRDGGNQAFNILAGYIFGGNTSQSKIAMTSPVLDEVQSEKIAMTSPVLENLSNGGDRTFSFILPSQYTLETLPTPNDNRVIIKEIASKKVAVISFSGLWNQKRFDVQLEKLRTALKEKNISFSPDYTRASYDPPLVPWFLRTNEIHIELGES